MSVWLQNHHARTQSGYQSNFVGANTRFAPPQRTTRCRTFRRLQGSLKRRGLKPAPMSVLALAFLLGAGSGRLPIHQLIYWWCLVPARCGLPKNIPGNRRLSIRWQPPTGVPCSASVCVSAIGLEPKTCPIPMIMITTIGSSGFGSSR